MEIALSSPLQMPIDPSEEVVRAAQTDHSRFRPGHVAAAGMALADRADSAQAYEQRGDWRVEGAVSGSSQVIEIDLNLVNPPLNPARDWHCGSIGRGFFLQTECKHE